MPKFGVLEDVEVTDAWAHEASIFTPWLADNLDRLGATLGMSLELISREAGLPTEDDRFSADIHAINLDDDSTVLIENQLAGSDHTHLGQILTYLAGLKARSVIWVAPQFREAHLAALRWLNENTTDDFSFFAARLRVVRIGPSALAPIFDILEKPNDWGRRIAAKARSAEALSDLGIARSKFWEFFNKHHPDRASDNGGGGNPSRWIHFAPNLALKYYVAKDHVGIYVKGRRNITTEETHELLGQRLADFAVALEAPPLPVDGEWFLLKKRTGDFQNTVDASTLGDWLAEQAARYVQELSRHFEIQ